MKGWYSKLTAKQRRHLVEIGVHTREEATTAVQNQDNNAFPCWECISIGRRLGIPYKLTAFHDACDLRKKEEKEIEVMIPLPVLQQFVEAIKELQILLADDFNSEANIPKIIGAMNALLSVIPEEIK